MERLGTKDAYVIDNGEYIYFYLGNQIDDTFIQNVNLEIYIEYRFLAMPTSAMPSSAVSLHSIQLRAMKHQILCGSSLSRSDTRRAEELISH